LSTPQTFFHKAEKQRWLELLSIAANSARFGHLEIAQRLALHMESVTHRNGDTRVTFGIAARAGFLGT
jgi:hypothetical protein